MAAEGSYHFSKKEEGKKNRKKERKRKKRCFLSPRSGRCQGFARKNTLLGGAQRRPKGRFFRSKPEGPDLDSGRGAGYLRCPFFFLRNDKRSSWISNVFREIHSNAYYMSRIIEGNTTTLSTGTDVGASGGGSEGGSPLCRLWTSGTELGGLPTC